MEYKIDKKGIQIFGKEDFNPQHILECGQIFSYDKTDFGYVVFSQEKMAKIFENQQGFRILTDDVDYFENFFDLRTDYSVIKEELRKFPILQKPIEFGYGIRILKQDLFETLISFIISANNNIKRIKLIINRLKENFGNNMGSFFAFPTRTQLLNCTEERFKELGAGYRSAYLYKVLRQVDIKMLQDWSKLSTNELRNKLIELAGVGPKVADCVLLFGYGRQDVFPVDTWITKMYNKFYQNLENRELIRKKLTQEFKLFSGYAQQYLFFFMRDGLS